MFDVVVEVTEGFSEGEEWLLCDGTIVDSGLVWCKCLVSFDGAKMSDSVDSSFNFFVFGPSKWRKKEL